MGPDTWAAGEEYEPYVGRWSRLVARRFVAFLAAPAGLEWLDIGCGTGALSATLLDDADAAQVTGIDPSAGFVDFARTRLAGRPATFDVGDAEDLPYSPVTFDAVVSGLVLNFVPDADRALREQHRVLRPGGLVGAYVWDYPRVGFMQRYWDAARTVDPDAPDEADRFAGWTADGLSGRLTAAGFEDVVTDAIEIDTPFADVDDLWKPFLGGQGAAPSHLARLEPDRRDAVRAAVEAQLPSGPFTLTARAWAVMGRRPRA